jgi:hypothetical protein
MHLMPFQKGNTLRKEATHQRRDFTVELLAQLDEIVKYKLPLTKEQLSFKQRIIRNLLMRAACLGDEFDAEGKLIKEGMGDLQAILAILDRLEGKPAQRTAANVFVQADRCEAAGPRRMTPLLEGCYVVQGEPSNAAMSERAGL